MCVSVCVASLYTRLVRRMSREYIRKGRRHAGAAESYARGTLRVCSEYRSEFFASPILRPRNLKDILRRLAETEQSRKSENGVTRAAVQADLRDMLCCPRACIRERVLCIVNCKLSSYDNNYFLLPLFHFVIIAFVSLGGGKSIKSETHNID